MLSVIVTASDLRRYVYFIFFFFFFFFFWGGGGGGGAERGGIGVTLQLLNLECLIINISHLIL